MTVEPKTTQFDPTRGFAMNKHGWSGKKPSGHLIKILDGAFGCDAKKTFDAALDLASSLEEMGETGAATRIRTRLERVPASVLKAGQPGRTLNPISSNGGRHMLDERKPLHGQRDRLILAESVNRMIDDFLADIRAHDALAEAGVADPCRLLIEGPPGVGKTSIASVIACELDFPLLTLRCDGVIDSLMGSTGSNLRKVFDHAALTPCVLLLDEFDALARSRSGDGKDVGEMHRVVIGLLQGLDALPDDTVVVAATNHAHLLDPAVWRRFPRKLTLGLPGVNDRAELWRAALGRYWAEPIDCQHLADQTEGLSHADIATTARQAIRGMILANDQHLSSARVEWQLEIQKAMKEERNPKTRSGSFV